MRNLKMNQQSLENMKQKVVSNALALAMTMQVMCGSAFAAVADSKLATGTTQLINDVTTWLMVLAPVLAGMMIIYYCIRRSAADEMEQKQWTNRITAAVVSCIGAIIGSATLQIIVAYYTA